VNRVTSQNVKDESVPAKRSVSFGRLQAPDLLFLALAVLSLIYFLQLRLTHDVSWQFWIARQMVHGVPLYDRIMEINPPLWFWMAMPLEVIGRAIGVAPDRLYVVLIIGLTCWSALATGRLLFMRPSGKRFVFMLVLALLCLVGPIFDFGQREQLAAIMTLPYAALLFKRVAREPVTQRLAIGVAICAAFGFALKHYFALVPIALELWLLWHRRKLRDAFRIETLILASLSIAYAVAIVALTPGFLTKILPLVAAAYDGYERTMLVQLSRYEVFFWAFCTIGFFFGRRHVSVRDRRVLDGLYIAGAAYACGYFLQQKGWQYHAVPTTIFLALMMTYYVLRRYERLGAILRHPVPTLAALSFIAVGVGRGPYASQWASDMPSYLAGLKRGDSIMILTADPRRVFPFVEEMDLIWPSRHFAHWMVSAISKAEFAARFGHPVAPALQTLSRDIPAQAYEDIICHPPTLILSQIFNPGYRIAPSLFRMTDFFRRDPRFRNYLAENYRLVSANFMFESYRRTTPLIVKGHNCTPVYLPGQ
jgi:hypothetical protein